MSVEFSAEEQDKINRFCAILASEMLVHGFVMIYESGKKSVSMTAKPIWRIQKPKGVAFASITLEEIGCTVGFSTLPDVSDHRDIWWALAFARNELIEHAQGKITPTYLKQTKA